MITAAENGTLFLDEIGDLPLGLQPKLLRFLQEGEIHTLGDRAPRKVNVRVIAATHKDLEQLVEEKLFREDLYYRIATLTLKFHHYESGQRHFHLIRTLSVSMLERMIVRLLESLGKRFKHLRNIRGQEYSNLPEKSRLCFTRMTVDTSNLPTCLRIKPDGTSFETSAEKFDDF